MSRAYKQAGQSLIESALVLTAFMGLLIGMATVGETLFVRQTLADRARLASRWGALNNYDPVAIRRVVLYGTAHPAPGDSAFFGLTPDAVEVSNPGCPGPQCRVSVAIPAHGIRCVEPAANLTQPSIQPLAASKP
jgi:TadE-like protein